MRNRLTLTIFNLFFIPALLISGSSVFALSVEERNEFMQSLTPAREKFYNEILNAYAPIYYHAGKITKRGEEEEYDPQDAPVHPHVDGDKDIRNNTENVLATLKDADGKPVQKVALKAQVLGNVMETQTHWVLVYTMYHVRDTSGNHANDAEAVINYIRKTGSKFGKLEFTLTRIHGFVGVYAPDPELEMQLQEAYYSAIGLMNAVKLRHGVYALDPLAKPHHEKQRDNEKSKTKYYKADEEPRHFVAFVHPGTHAIFRCNEEEFKDGMGAGFIYKHVPKGKEGVTQCYPMPPKKDRLVGYSIHHFDLDLLALFPPLHVRKTFDEAKSKELNDLVAMQFEGPQPAGEPLEVEDGLIERRTDIMKDFVRGMTDKNKDGTPMGPEANLFYDYKLGMGETGRLWAPHIVPQKLFSLAKRQETFSSVNLFNLFANYTKVTKDLLRDDKF